MNNLDNSLGLLNAYKIAENVSISLIKFCKPQFSLFLGGAVEFLLQMKQDLHLEKLLVLNR